MLDIQYIRENPELVTEKSAQKGYSVDVSRLLELDARRRELVTKLENLRADQNQATKIIKTSGIDEATRNSLQVLKTNIKEIEAELEPVTQEYHDLLRAVPNMPVEGVPVGATEDENIIAKIVGEPTQFDFTPKHDFELAQKNDLFDKERAAKIAGSRFVYLKGGLVRLQFAIVNYVMQTLGDESVIEKIIADNDIRDTAGNLLTSKPFTPVLPPAMLRTEPYVASARLNAAEVTYKLEQDDLWLNASAEHTICTMYWNEILPQDMFPVRYLGYSTSFRREAGTYGKDVEGIFRLHQFDKLEMEVFSTPETGYQEHLLQIAIQEYLVRSLGIPYRLVKKCTADIGKPNASGYDIDCWFPGQQAYRETHTADYISDYQSRDLKIRVRRSDGSVELVHTIDGTAFALSRILKAIMENFQTADGSIIVPDVLRPYMGGVQEI